MYPIIDLKKTYLKTKLNFESNILIIKNFSYLSVLQGVNLIIPLILYPYLIRVFKTNLYGTIVFIQTIISYFVIVINFGFNFSATKEISINRNNNHKLLEITNSVLCIKGLILIICVFILYLVANFIPYVNNYKPLFYLSMWMIIYEFLFPVWFFQGIEDMKYITYLTLINKIIIVLLVFIFITSPKHYLRLPLIYGVGAVTSSLIGLYIIFNKIEGTFYFPKIKVLLKYIRGAFFVFVSNISNKIYVGANKLIIGMFLGPNEVAYYDLGEKILQLLRLPITVIGQTVFPRISITKSKRNLNKIMLIQFIFISLITIIIYWNMKCIILILGGIEMLPAVGISRIMILAIFFISINAFLAPYRLIPFGYLSQFARVSFYSFVTYIIIISILIISKNINLQSLAITNIVVELIVLLIALNYCVKYKLLK